MNLAIDIGNTAAKWGTFEGRKTLSSGTWTASQGDGVLERLVGAADRVLVSASGQVPEVLATLPRLDSSTSLPIHLDYKTPTTLGADRIADACGAAGLYPGQPCLVIDAGTCITVDFIDADATYHGGAIMPGLEMNLHALHTFTAKLPLVSLDTVEHTPVMGRSTEESIVAGTLGATLLALAGYVALYKEKAAGLHVLLTGGDAARLSAGGTKGWEHVPLLTLQGMNEIMRMQEAGCVN